MDDEGSGRACARAALGSIAHTRPPSPHPRGAPRLLSVLGPQLVRVRRCRLGGLGRVLQALARLPTAGCVGVGVGGSATSAPPPSSLLPPFFPPNPLLIQAASGLHVGGVHLLQPGPVGGDCCACASLERAIVLRCTGHQLGAVKGEGAGGGGRNAPGAQAGQLQLGGEGGRGRGRGAPARRHTPPTVPCRPPSRAACPLRNPTTPNGARLEIGVRLGHQGDLFASAEGRRVAGGRRIGGMDGCACWPLPPSTLPRLLLIRPPHTQQLASPSAAWLAHDSPGVTRGRWVRWWAWRGTFRAAHPAHPYQPPQCTATPHKRGDRMAWRWRQRPSARCCRRCTTGPRRPVGCGARRTSWHVCVPGAYHTP